MGPMRGGRCNSNSCMKLSFEGGNVNAPAWRSGISRQPPSPPPPWTRGKMVLRRRGGGETVRPTIFEQKVRERADGLQYVRPPEGMAQPRAVVHDQACPARGADLQAAGRRRPALEGDPGPGGPEEEGPRRGPVEHVHAAVVARGRRIPRRGIEQPGICAARRGNGPHRLGLGGVQLLGAGYRQHGSVDALRLPGAQEAVAAAADGRRDPLRLPDDGARGRLVGRHQYRDTDRSATAITTSSTAANGGRLASAIPAARSRS